MGVSLQYQFARRWMVIGDVSYRSSPNDSSDSSLVDSDSPASFLIAIVRAF